MELIKGDKVYDNLLNKEGIVEEIDDYKNVFDRYFEIHNEKLIYVGSGSYCLDKFSKNFSTELIKK
jgi:hypothetical protein